MARSYNKPLPHLDVYSDFLVYVTNAPTYMRGKEIKSRINNQFGPVVRFLETFEAWEHRLTGNLVIEFANYRGSEEFMTAVLNQRTRFMDAAGVQHIGIVGRPIFFELVHRDTGIDLLDCGGKPNPEWKRRENGRPGSRGSETNMYNRDRDRRSRSRSLLRERSGRNSRHSRSRERGRISHNSRERGYNSRSRGRISRERNSPSSDESVGPFPSGSRSIHRLVKSSTILWHCKRSGQTHTLNFTGEAAAGVYRAPTTKLSSLVSLTLLPKQQPLPLAMKPTPPVSHLHHPRSSTDEREEGEITDDDEKLEEGELKESDDMNIEQQQNENVNGDQVEQSEEAQSEEGHSEEVEVADEQQQTADVDDVDTDCDFFEFVENDDEDDVPNTNESGEERQVSATNNGQVEYDEEALLQPNDDEPDVKGPLDERILDEEDDAQPSVEPEEEHENDTTNSSSPSLDLDFQQLLKLRTEDEEMPSVEEMPAIEEMSTV